MDPFCNICFKNFQAAKCELFCTDCQHVICQECLKGRDFCGMCNKKCRLMKISNTMPQNMKKFFTDVRPELTGVMKIVKFQDAQRAIGANHAQRILKEYYDSKRRLEAIKKEYDELAKEIAKVKQEERSSAGSNRGSFSTLRTPQSSMSGNSGFSGSSFTRNVNTVEEGVMMDTSLWNSPASSTGKSFDLNMSNLTLGPRRSLGTSSHHNKFQK